MTEERAREKAVALEIRSFIEEYFSELDSDGNGFISTGELEAFGAQHKEHAKIIEKILRRYNHMCRARDEELYKEHCGISIRDAEDYERGVRQGWIIYSFPKD